LSSGVVGRRFAALSAGSSSTTWPAWSRRTCTCTTRFLVCGVVGRLVLDDLGDVVTAFLFLHERFLVGGVVGPLVLDDLDGRGSCVRVLHHALFGGRRRRAARARRLERRGRGVCVHVLAPLAFWRAASSTCSRSATSHPRRLGRRGGGVLVLAPRAFWRAASSASSTSTSCAAASVSGAIIRYCEGTTKHQRV
jgi:hypothetical protein